MLKPAVKPDAGFEGFEEGGLVESLRGDVRVLDGGFDRAQDRTLMN